MLENKLSKEAISLIHHVQLNETGWFKKAFRRLIISVFVENNNTPINKEEVKEKLITALGSDIKFRFDSDFDALIGSGTIICNKLSIPNTYSIAEDKYQQYSNDAQGQGKYEIEAKNKFIALCTEHQVKALDCESIWFRFNAEAIIPTIKSMGAKAYHLLTSKNIEENKLVSDFLEQFSQQQKGLISKVILDFFDFSNENIKKYILSLLHAHFFVLGFGLDAKSIEALNLKKQKNMTLFVDTNFLLSLIQLHDNPANEATNALRELLKEIEGRVKVKFSILSVTREEFINLIEREKNSIERLKLNLNSIKAIIEMGDDANISGILKKYAQVCNLKKTVIPTSDYFDKYIKNSVVTFKSYGVEIHNKDYSNFKMMPDVIDSIMHQKDYWEKKIDKNTSYSSETKFYKKERLYSVLAHDCSLWHIVKSLRSYTDDIKNIEKWIITLDYKLINFDKYKEDINNVGLCLHPNDLVSMLQFWMPRTSKLENAILENFKLPFLGSDFDLEAEAINKRILESMAQYEDYNEMSTDTIKELLTNEALAERIKKSASIEDDVNALREAIFQKLEQAKEREIKTKLELEEIKAKNEKLHSDVEKLHLNVEEMTKKNDSDRKQQIELMRLMRQTYAVNIANGLRLGVTTNKHILEKTKALYEKDLLENKTKIDEYVRLLKQKYEMQKKTKKWWHFGLVNVDSHNQQIELYMQKELEYEYIINLNKKQLELSKELEIISMQLKDWDGVSIWIYCENTNAVHFNALELADIHFDPAGNSEHVFSNVQKYPSRFGLRDRDFLSDLEIEKIKRKYPNFIATKYYCFENYLLHPSNLQELVDKGVLEIDIAQYVDNLRMQKNLHKNTIISKLREIRKGYSEFKQPQLKFQDKDLTLLEGYLNSDDVELFLKSFSLKKGGQYFSRKFLEQYNIKENLLVSTIWFQNQIQELLKI